MARKLKLTRPELKLQRDALARYSRYLPMLKLKQQQLQLALRDLEAKRRTLRREYETAVGRFSAVRDLLSDSAGVDVEALAAVKEIKTAPLNIAGVKLREFSGVEFEDSRYSLFSTPVWVDRVLEEYRDVNRRHVKIQIVDETRDLLGRELRKVVQRVNLFEQVKIPGCREAIRVIRIHLGDEMTAGVGRAKLAKAKIDAVARQGDNL